MGNYNLAVLRNDKDITATRVFSRNKTGFTVNAEKQISKSAGVFAIASYNDGKNETWCFTEIDRSLGYGYTVHGDTWKQSNDVPGVAVVQNGLSKDHRNFLAAGGNGFMIDDGKLNYSMETIIEWYYKISMFHNKFSLSPGYQFVINPACNKDRGPVHVIGLRFHTEW
ncbi:MAG: carbohydrate porin [Chitinophagaceae bacterium]|nr:carbohydrate porin [Chitinophagaceae bacterium]